MRRWMGLAGALALAGCGGDDDLVTIRTGTTAAEAACLAAVDRSMAGRTTRVIDSEFSDAGTAVDLRSADGTEWRCTATNDGVISALTMG